MRVTPRINIRAKFPYLFSNVIKAVCPVVPIKSLLFKVNEIDSTNGDVVVKIGASIMG
jgi:hypothetical protein